MLEKAVEQLEAFWNNVDKGLASIPEGIEKLPGWDKWQEVSNNRCSVDQILNSSMTLGNGMGVNN